MLLLRTYRPRRKNLSQFKMMKFIAYKCNVTEIILFNYISVETLIGVDNASGILRVLSLLFKHGNRETLVQYVPTVMKEIEELKKKGEINNAVFRKSVIKVIQRLGLTLLKQRVASWRYSRGNRSLADNMASSLDKNNSQQIVTMVTGDEDEEYDIPDEIEDILGYLLHGLRDKDTIVRWSAAKGIGRITGRLPKELADEVVGSVLELFTMQETDAAWHGGCLSLAELGRRGLLLPQRLPDVVPVILQSLAYDKKKGSFSVGAHVRDAACYVCWAFARAYNPEELSSYVNDVACALVITSIFDREVNVRRAAAAAFQENVGRQGAFPHGIDIVTEADYFKVGNRENCYLELSVFVAQFPEYTQPMIDHLVDVKINHWDSEIKDLSAKGLHNLTRCSPDYMAKEVMPKLLPMTTGEDLYMRYGAIIAMAEITHMLAEISTNEGKTITDVLHKDIIDGMKNITFKLREAKYFKGVGGDVMRKAAICLIKKLSLSKLPFHDDPVIDLWQDIIDECLSVKDAEDDIQTAAVSAIPAFFTAYYKTDDGCADTKRQETVIKKCFSQLNSSDQTTRMGFSLALGALPSFMIKGRLHSILQTLIKATEITRKEAAWAKSRRDALRAINGICKTVGLDLEGSPADVICKNNLLDIYDALFIALTDYTSDSKGDVGAWVREASMTCLHDLTIMVVNKDPSILSYQIYEKIFCSLVQQACEKMDRIRIHAGLILSQLLYHKPQLPHIPHRDELEKTFPKEEMIDFNWSASYHTFPCFAKLLGCESYTYYILLGFTVSVGGLTESVVKYSSSSIQSYLREIQSDKEKLKKFTDVLAQIFTNYLKNNRVSLSLLKMLDQLLYNGCFDVLVNDDTNTFPMEIYEFTKKEIAGSADPNKIIAGGEVYCGLLQFSEDIRSKSLTQLMILVCSKFPKVRKVTANRLYEALITYEELVPEEVSSDITTLLSETVWDKKIDEIRPIRNKLCDLLGLARPVTKIKAKQGELKMDTKDS